MTASLLPLPDDPVLRIMVDEWPDPIRWPIRARWLTAFEYRLRHFYPTASSRDLSLTARHYAPFPLAAGHYVP